MGADGTIQGLPRRTDQLNRTVTRSPVARRDSAAGKGWRRGRDPEIRHFQIYLTFKVNLIRLNNTRINGQVDPVQTDLFKNLSQPREEATFRSCNILLPKRSFVYPNSRISGLLFS